MAKVVVHDIDPRVDGEYELASVDDWSYDEWYMVKKQTGLVLSDFLTAEDTGMADSLVILAIASVSLERAGITKAHMALRHGRIDNIDLVPDEEEIEAAEEEEAESPPEVEPPGSEPSSDDNTGTGGASAKPPLALSVVDPTPTGDQTSPTGSPPSEIPESSVG